MQIVMRIAFIGKTTCIGRFGNGSDIDSRKNENFVENKNLTEGYGNHINRNRKSE